MAAERKAPRRTVGAGAGWFVEEFVVARAINAMSSLAQQGLLEKVSLFEMLRDILPYLVHPNIWIRQAAVGMVVAVAAKLDTVDVQVPLVDSTLGTLIT